MTDPTPRQPPPLLFRLLRALFTTSLGRMILVAALILGAASLAQLVWRELSRPEAEVRRDLLKDTLDAAGEAVERYADAQPDDAQRVVPESTPWAPAALECGRETLATPAEAAHPTWRALGVKLDAPTRYQLRFTGMGRSFELLARTDADCDGIYEVHRRRGALGLTGLKMEPVAIENPGE